VDRNEEIGVALGTRLGTNPLYISVGHKVTLDIAVDLVLKCCKGYRLPETTRYAPLVAGGEELNLDPQQLSLL